MAHTNKGLVFMGLAVVTGLVVFTVITLSKNRHKTWRENVIANRQHDVKVGLGTGFLNSTRNLKDLAEAGDQGATRELARQRMLHESFVAEVNDPQLALQQTCPGLPEKLEDGAMGIDLRGCHASLARNPSQQSREIWVSYIPINRLAVTRWETEFLDHNESGKLIKTQVSPVIKVLAPGPDGVNVAKRLSGADVVSPVQYELRGTVILVVDRDSPSYFKIWESK